MALMYTIIGWSIFFIIYLRLTRHRSHLFIWLLLIRENRYVIHVNAFSLFFSEKRFGLFETNVFCIQQTSRCHIIYRLSSAFSATYAHAFLKAVISLLVFLAFGVWMYASHSNVRNFELSEKSKQCFVCSSHFHRWCGGSNHLVSIVRHGFSPKSILHIRHSEHDSTFGYQQPICSFGYSVRFWRIRGRCCEIYSFLYQWFFMNNNDVAILEWSLFTWCLHCLSIYSTKSWQFCSSPPRFLVTYEYTLIHLWDTVVSVKNCLFLRNMGSCIGPQIPTWTVTSGKFMTKFPSDGILVCFERIHVSHWCFRLLSAGFIPYLHDFIIYLDRYIGMRH